MKIYINADVFGWRMTGLVGEGGSWFLGYSKPSKDGHSFIFPWSKVIVVEWPKLSKR